MYILDSNVTWEHNCLVFNFQVFFMHLVFGEASQKLLRFHINKNRKALHWL